ncbi:hypothetical protein [Brevirhabdus sp.]
MGRFGVDYPETQHTQETKMTMPALIINAGFLAGLGISALMVLAF